MTTNEELTHNVDRSKWGPGPWDGEPDRFDWKHNGLPCFVLRNNFGAWCGYVGVPRGHALYGRPYDDINVSVHGGLTFAERCSPPICHIPEPGESDDVWWFGFDCAHAGDLAPGMQAMLSELPSYSGGYLSRDVYRDLNYVKRETTELADQIKTATPEKMQDDGMLQLARITSRRRDGLPVQQPIASRTIRKTKRLRRQVNQACRNFRGRLFIFDKRVSFKQFVMHNVMNEGGQEGHYARAWVQRWRRHEPTNLEWTKEMQRWRASQLKKSAGLQQLASAKTEDEISAAAQALIAQFDAAAAASREDPEFVIATAPRHDDEEFVKVWNPAPTSDVPEGKSE